MTKTRNKLKIMGLLLALVMMVSLLGLFSLTASAEAAADLTVTIDTGASVILKDADGDGYYDIGTADALYAFAAAVNGGNTAINGELTANIVVNKNVLTADGKLNGDGSNFRAWTPIGDGRNSYYAGIFNGNGYTISGLYLNNNEVSYVGLFGEVVRSGKVTNVGIIENYINGNDYIGGVVGYNDYGTIENCYNMGSICCNNDYSAKVGGVVGYNYYGTLNNCYNTGNVSGTDYGVGGVVGYNIYGTVGNCYNTGTVSSTYSGVGGVAGVTDYNCIVLNSYNTGNISGTKYIGGVVGRLINGSTVQNCYNTGNVSGTDVCVGGVVGGIYKENTVTNCYYLSGCAKDGNSVTQFGIGNETAGSTTADVSGSTTGKNSLDFGNGSVCELVGYHSIDENCVCTNCGVVEHNNFDIKGFCTLCEAYQPAVDSNSDGYYEISNAGQLFWFAQQVNVEGKREIKGVLTADIDLENRPWTPIGETGENNKNFRGVFDGQNHTIKGLYVEGTQNGVGFFGEVRTGTVKNFTIYGEVIVNTEVDYVGGVIGSICGVNGETDLERNGAIIQNITSYVNLTAKAHGVGMIGGFVGYANHQSLIENCSWYGTFDAGIYRVDSGAGGFIGKIQENTSEVTIRNCAAYGTIKTNYAGDYNNTATIYMGGFLSFSNTGAKTTLENCLFAGKFERGENLTDQAFLGAFGTLRSVNAIKNCYYLGDGVLEAVHSNSDLKPGSDNVEITSVTKAQLLSGEVAYKLGERFGQILEGENRQSYPVLGETKVQDSQRFEIYGQQLNIGGDLSMKYYVMGYAPAFNSGALYMEFSHNGVKTKVYAGEPNADGFYVFVLEGINPQCMGDSIRAMLCYNETEVASHGFEDGKEYSVEKNLLNLLEKYKDDAALVTLIKDTLAYGEATSAYKKHQTMTGNTYTENSSNREIPVSEAQVADVITGYTVRFGTAISIIIEVNPSAFEDTIYKVECNGTELRNFPSPNSPLYKVSNIAATDFDKEWEFVVRSTNPMGDVYGTVVISVNDYLYAISQSSTDEKMVNLAKALYNYGVSAEIYNHVKTGEGDHYYVDNVCACGKLETIDATAMTADELKAAVADQLAAGKTNINVALAADAEQEMFSAIWTAFSESTAADGSINLTISGAKTVPDYGFFDNDNYSENGEKNIAGDKLKSLTLPDVETIGDFAFSACTYLESVNLPQVVTIGECAFNEWKKGTKLTSLNLPNATTIGDWAFAYSSLLTSVNLPKVVTIGTVAFADCDLRTLDLPEATTIGGEAFMNNDNLVSCSAPKATTIDYYPWGSNGTSKLERLELTAVGDFTLGNNLFAYTPTEQIDLVLNKDKETQVTQNEDGTATWKTTNSNGGKLEYTFKSITFVGE